MMNKHGYPSLKVFCLGLLAAAALCTWFRGHPLAMRLRSHPVPPAATPGVASLGQAGQRVKASFAKLPLHFEANQGQTAPPVKFLARGGGYTLFLTATEAVLSLASPASARGTRHERLQVSSQSPEAGEAQPALLRMRLVGANLRPRVAGRDTQPGKASYFLGDEPARWRANVPTYARVEYQRVYPGVDLVYYGNQQQLEYDFIVAPGADPRRIVLGFEGADRLEVDAAGDLVLHTPGGRVVQRAPRIYQEIDGARRDVPGSYLLQPAPSGEPGDARVTFRVGTYDPRRPLVIDPVLVYSTFLGGSGGDFAFDMAVDPAGGIYVTGQTTSIDFPVAGPFQPAYGGGTIDAFVVKLNASGSALVYATYLGGGGFDRARGIGVDAAGNAYLAGHTDSSNFPTVNALQPVIGGSQDGFVTKLNPTGSGLVFSTYLGGSSLDQCLDLPPWIAGDVAVTGQTFSDNFPTAQALQPTYGGGGDAFVAKLHAGGAALLHSTYLGGSLAEIGEGLASDDAGNTYVTGRTRSTNFPTVHPLQAAKGDSSSVLNDAFVAKYDATGSVIVYATYLGGSREDVGWRIAVDSSGNAYLTGRTSSLDFPTATPLQPVYGGGRSDAFVAKLDHTGGILLYSTYLGGSGEENPVATGIAVDAAGDAHVAGWTSSSNFPTVNALQPVYGGNGDAFVAKLNASGGALLFSSYLGGASGDEGTGIAADAFGSTYISGATSSVNFPTVRPYQLQPGGGADAFVAKIVAVTLDVKPGEYPNSVSLRSRGLLPVAILSSPRFRAGAVDASTVTLRDPRLRGTAVPARQVLEDVDGDGDWDLLLFFRTADLVDNGALDAQSTDVVLRGKTAAGDLIAESDSVSIVP